MTTERKPPSPNERKVLNAISRADGGDDKLWWMRRGDVENGILADTQARGYSAIGEYEWHWNTVRSHIKRLIDKGWLEKRYVTVEGTRRVEWRRIP